VTHRERVLGQARADLVALPGLCEELARCLTERAAVAGVQRKVSGSPALIRLDVFHLLDPRRKPGWDGADPREENYAGWLGVAPLLESWVRVLWEDLPEILELTETATVRSEASVLVEFWPFIEAQQWAEELAKDVSRAAETVRRTLGIRPDYQPKCRKCGFTVIPVEADTRKLTTWEACAYGACTGCDWTYPKGPALDALAQVQEPLPLAEIADVAGIPIKTLYRWHAEELIVPVDGVKRKRVYDLAAVRAVANVKFGRKLASATA
jgi:predicted Zn-ribbon and HTH transcriptional regulator